MRAGEQVGLRLDRRDDRRAERRRVRGLLGAEALGSLLGCWAVVGIVVLYALVMDLLRSS